MTQNFKDLEIFKEIKDISKIGFSYLTKNNFNTEKFSFHQEFQIQKEILKNLENLHKAQNQWNISLSAQIGLTPHFSRDFPEGYSGEKPNASTSQSLSLNLSYPLFSPTSEKNIQEYLNEKEKNALEHEEIQKKYQKAFLKIQNQWNLLEKNITLMELEIQGNKELMEIQKQMQEKGLQSIEPVLRAWQDIQSSEIEKDKISLSQDWIGLHMYLLTQFEATE